MMINKNKIKKLLISLIPIKQVRKYLRNKINLNIKLEEKGYNTEALKTVMQHSFKLCCKIGDYSYCGENCYVPHSETTIGKFCSISDNVCIGAGNHPTNFLSTSPFFYLDYLGWVNKNKYEHIIPCSIGNDVWIGRNVFIKDGIKISDGAIVAAGAVVTKDVPPYAIVGGVPAKIIRYRFDEETIKQLLELKWWDLDTETIKKIPFKDVNEAIAFIKGVKK